MSPQDLSTLLWQERELLELLVFKLEEEQLLLTSGRTRRLHHVTREVEQVLERLRDTGLARAVHASGVAKEWGIDGTATLRELAAAAPDEPWGELLTAHLQAMTVRVAQIGALRDSNQHFMRAASRSAQHTLAGIGTGAGMYATDGAASHRHNGHPPSSTSTCSGTISTFNGLAAARAGLDVTGQKIADANPQGYTRSVDADGAAVFGSGTTAAFALLDTIAADLRAGRDVSVHLAALQQRIQDLTAHHTEIGTRHARLLEARDAATDASLALEGERATVEEVDLASVILDLKLQETAYQSALAVSARVLQPSLMDFLR